MTKKAKHIVTLTFEEDCIDEYEAAYSVYMKLTQLLASPTKGKIMANIENAETSENFAIDLFDGVLEVNPLFASQVIGTRHLIWISQNPPRKQK
jgi:hypothetical protein